MIIISDYSHLKRVNPAILKNAIEEPECSFMILKSDRPMYAGADEFFDKLYGAEKLMNVFPTNGLNVISLLKEQFQPILLRATYDQDKIVFMVNRLFQTFTITPMVPSGLFLVSEIELDCDDFSKLKPAEKLKYLKIEQLQTYTYIVHVT